MGHDEIGGGDVRAEEPRDATASSATDDLGDDESRARCSGAMPANVSVSDRPIVTAGLAKLVDDVNQYAAAM